MAARRDLQIRVLAEPKDIAARLALAAVDDQLGWPADAIDQLEAVVALGGPVGIRWHDADRARLARLLVARGRARLERAAPSALADLERARGFGAEVAPADVRAAKLALAIRHLRHVDGDERAKGRALLVELGGDDRWAGARPIAAPAQAGAFGAWLWTVGARREAYEQLARWHAATPAPRDPVLQAAYVRALAWWQPPELPPPPADELGAQRCWFEPGGCETAEPASTVSAVVGDPAAAAAARYAITATGATDAAKLVAIGTAYRRDPAIAERLGRELVAASVDAAAGHAAIAALFDALGDPARARVEWQAAVDASTGPHPTGEPSGARAADVEPSEADPAYVRGLAGAVARAGDGSAALVFATAAAAASGDPAPVWISIARGLHDSGRDVEALSAAHSALELAGREALPRALEVAIAASRALGRTAQADVLAARLGHTSHDDDALAAYRAQPTAATLARLWVASRAHPRDLEMRIVLRAALSADDPRRAAIDAELVALAGDSDLDFARAAIAALR